MICGNLWVPTHILPDEIPEDIEECGVLLGKHAEKFTLARALIKLDNTHPTPMSNYKMYVPPIFAKETVALWHTHTKTVWPSEADMGMSIKLGLPGIVITPDWTVCVYDGRTVYEPFQY